MRIHAMFGTVSLFCFLLSVTYAVNDDQCKLELEKVLSDNYPVKDPCYGALKNAITATTVTQCKNMALVRDCFAMQVEAWTDLVDDCEDVFQTSACLKTYSDDAFERWLKSDCAQKTSEALAKYSITSPCRQPLVQWLYAPGLDKCPTDVAFVQACFNDQSSAWVSATDECEELLKSPCFKGMTDDGFEAWMAAGQCASEANTILAKYGSNDTCVPILMKAMGSISSCPDMNDARFCFMRYEDMWTDLLDECEKLFKDSECLKQYTDDSFEVWLKDECATEVNAVLNKYTDECVQVIRDGMYAIDKKECPAEEKLRSCFQLYELSWTELVDDCEDVFKSGVCLNSFTDDDFENWLDGSNTFSKLALP